MKAWATSKLPDNDNQQRNSSMTEWKLYSIETLPPPYTVRNHKHTYNPCNNWSSLRETCCPPSCHTLPVCCSFGLSGEQGDY